MMKWRVTGVVLGVLALAAVGVAQAPSSGAAKDDVPRLPWGHPDLQGVWTSDNESGVPMTRPARFKDKAVLEGADLEAHLKERELSLARTANFGGGITGAGPVHWYEWWGRTSPRTSLIVDPPDGQMPPLTPAAKTEEARRQKEWEKLVGARGPADSWEDRELWDRCIMRALPGAMFPTGYNNNAEIVQTPDHVVIINEMIHEVRVVPLDGRPHLSSTTQQWLGDSRGRWDGDTLVVETKNFIDTTDPRMSVGVNSRGAFPDSFRIVERFKRLDNGTLLYEITRDDPKTWTRPWTAALYMKKTPQEYVFEYGCHEGNIGMENILSGARVEEKANPALLKRRAVRPAPSATGEERIEVR